VPETRSRSRGTFVFVDNSPEDVASRHTAWKVIVISAEMPPGWRIHIQRPVRSMLVIVREVGSQNGLEVASSQDEDAVEALTRQGADKPLSERVSSRCLNRGADNSHSFGQEDLVEGRRVLRVAIADEEAERTVSHRATKLRACWVTQEASGLEVTPARCTLRVAISTTNRT
jgi:hypothetical protein